MCRPLQLWLFVGLAMAGACTTPSHDSDFYPKDPLRSTPWTTVSAGELHACGINSGGLYCWGYHFRTDMSPNTDDPICEKLDGSYRCAFNTDNMGIVDMGGPVQVGMPTGWSQVTVGLAYSCGINNGTLYCWGLNDRGQLGTGNMEDQIVPVQIGTDTSWSDVDASQLMTCGINSGKLYCWGTGILGNGEESDFSVNPMQIGTSNTWMEVEVGPHHACGINSGDLYCWGQVDRWQENSLHFTPVRLGSDRWTFSSVAVGEFATCGIETGDYICWGDATLDSESNRKRFPRSTWTDITTSYGYTCGINSGELFCINFDDFSHSDVIDKLDSVFFENSITDSRQFGTAQSFLYEGWSEVSAGYTVACGIKTGRLYCWGKLTYDKELDTHIWVYDSRLGTYLGNSPIKIDGGGVWSNVVAGSNHTCGIKADSLYCWGLGSAGQLGSGEMIAVQYQPLLAVSDITWSYLAAGGRQTCGITKGSLYCWGDMRSSPQRIGGEDGWSSVATGKNHVCGIKDKSLYCWGGDDLGQRGDGDIRTNDNVDPGIPIQIGLENSWQIVASGKYHTCGIRAGSLYCWGDDSAGQLGSGDPIINHTSPQQIGSNSDWTAIVAGAAHTCGIRAGRLYCWGDDSSGQLGNGNSVTSQTSPQQIGPDSDWADIVAGAAHTCGIRAGNLYCWGNDRAGQLGNGKPELNQSSPVQIGSDDTWSHIAAGSEHTCGINAEQMYCWGDNSLGQRGDGWRFFNEVLYPVP